MSARANSEAKRSHRLSGAEARHDDSPLRRLQAYLADFNLDAGRRLPPERERNAQSKREYDAWDSRLHRTIATSSHNTMLLSLMDTLAAVRNAMSWGRLAANPGPPDPDHHSHAEHEAIVAAIEECDVSGAREAMRAHLEAVERNVLRVASS